MIARSVTRVSSSRVTLQRKCGRNVFKAKEPTSREQRRAAAIYRFALLEAYRERGIPEARDDTDDEKIEA